MSTLASLLVMLGLDASGFHKGAAQATGGAEKLLGTLGKLAAPAAIGAGVLAIGKMAWDAGKQFDEASDTIVTKTGATGATLAGLQDDLSAVFGAIPTDLAIASSALAELATRTGATGETLQNLAKPLLEVSRLTGGDATANAQLYARVMGDWGIPVEEGAKTLDKLFVVQQKTGVGLETLMQKVVQFGSPMRLMGFSIEDAAALFGKWEKEGVNAELVMGSLRIAAGKFARTGAPLRESLLGTFEEIQKNTDASAALALGMDVFGARAGPDMVAAIREGRFSIDDLTAAMAGADGAIMNTAKTTADFPEKLQVLRNKLTTVMAPLGLTMLDALTTAVEKATPWIERLIPLLPQIGTGLAAIGAVLAGAKIVGGITTLVGAVQKAGGVLGFLKVALGALAGPVGIVVALVALLAAAWMGNWGGIRDKAAEVWAALQPIFAQIVTWLQTNIPIAVATLANFWNTVLLPAIQAVGQFIQANVVPLLAVLWTWLQTNLPVALQFLSNFWKTILLPAIQAVWHFISTLLLPLLLALAHVAIAALKLAVRALAGLWENVLLPALTAVWKFINEKVGPIFEALAEKVKTGIGPALQWLNDNVLQPLVGAFGKIESAISGVIGWLDKMASKIGSLSLPDWLTPGSPTPFELGLLGIADALAVVAGTDVPLFSPQGPQLSYAGASAGGAGQAGRGGAGPITNHYAFSVTVHAPGGDPDQVAKATEQGVTRAGRALGLW